MTASITAREIVVLGKVRGNVTATDRVDIRAEGSLSGDVAAARISIEDGAFFKGGIDIRKGEPKTIGAQVPGNSSMRSIPAGPVVTAFLRTSPEHERPCIVRGVCAFLSGYSAV